MVTLVDMISPATSLPPTSPKLTTKSLSTPDGSLVIGILISLEASPALKLTTPVSKYFVKKVNNKILTELADESINKKPFLYKFDNVDVLTILYNTAIQ